MTRILLACFLTAFAAVAAHAADKAEKIHYTPVSLQSVSDVLFKKGILRTDDPAAVEEYIRIHHCDLYEEYKRDDFAWTRIREAQARDIDVHMPEFPEGLEISSGMRLSQYDFTASEFVINPKSQMENSGLITVIKEEGGSMTPCRTQNAGPFVPRVHPLELLIKIDTPITLKAIPMDRRQADELINIMNSRNLPTDEQKRQVTLVLRIRILGPDPLSSVTDPLRRTVLGAVDDLRIYEGPERKILLFRKDFESLRAEKGKN